MDVFIGIFLIIAAVLLFALICFFSKDVMYIARMSINIYHFFNSSRLCLNICL